MRAHLRYIAREGVTPEGKKGRFYSKDLDEADGVAFGDRCTTDRHQFRFIVSPEDAHELADLKAFTRQLMLQMERDLETKLDWVAVDHWDTDNPHVHVVLRGKAADGHDLIIASDYITQGMRTRGVHIATEWLGPRTEREMQHSMAREIQQERWTNLDATLVERSRERIVSLNAPGSDRSQQHQRTALLGRLAVLERMGLARRGNSGSWELAERLQPTLRAMGERGDIVKAMNRALNGKPRELAFPSVGESGPVVGQVMGKEMADELSDRGFLIVDATDGRTHYIALGPKSDLSDFAIGNLVRVQFEPAARNADRNIARATSGGLYRTQDHRAALLPGRDEREVTDILESYTRRLEALRRAGIVERQEEGVWRVPADFVQRARAYDRARMKEPTVTLRSTLTVQQQAKALGATWLDEQLARPDSDRSPQGFGAEVTAALSEREAFLAELGLAQRKTGRLLLVRDFMTQLRARELEAVAARIAEQSGLLHRPLEEGKATSGTYRRSLQLVSGRFALLDDGVGFTLVPWRAVIEPRLGQSLTAVAHGDRISWYFGRDRGLER